MQAWRPSVASFHHPILPCLVRNSFTPRCPMSHAPHSDHSAHSMNVEMPQCIDECLSCHSICLSTVHHCLEMGGAHAAPDHVARLLDCAQTCQSSADFMLRHSALHSQACALCAQACRACEQSCRTLAQDDEMMAQCADTCRRCAESCDRMSKMAA